MPIHNSIIIPVDPDTVDSSRRRQMSIVSLSQLPEYVEITNGRMYSDQMNDGIIEVIALDDSLFRNYYRVGDEFIYPARSGTSTVNLTLKVVGSFKPLPGKAIHDAYWYQGIDGYVNSFFISSEVFE